MSPPWSARAQEKGCLADVEKNKPLNRHTTFDVISPFQNVDEDHIMLWSFIVIKIVALTDDFLSGSGDTGSGPREKNKDDQKIGI